MSALTQSSLVGFSEDFIKLLYPKLFSALPSPAVWPEKRCRSMETGDSTGRPCAWCGQVIDDVTIDESDSDRSQRRTEPVSHCESPVLQPQQLRPSGANLENVKCSDDVERMFDPDMPNLQFCSDNCVTQYKMNWFCSETRFHLQQKQGVQVKTGLRVTHCQTLKNGRISHPVAAATAGVNVDLHKREAKTRRNTRSSEIKRPFKFGQNNGVNPATKPLKTKAAVVRNGFTFHPYYRIQSAAVSKTVKKTTTRSVDGDDKTETSDDMRSRFLPYSRKSSPFDSAFYRNRQSFDFSKLPKRDENNVSIVNSVDEAVGHTPVYTGTLDSDLPVAPIDIHPLKESMCNVPDLLTLSSQPAAEIWSARPSFPVVRLPVPVPVPILVPFPISMPVEGGLNSNDSRGIVTADHEIICKTSTSGEYSCYLDQTCCHGSMAKAIDGDNRYLKPTSWSSTSCCPSPSCSKSRSDTLASEALDLSNVRLNKSVLDEIDSVIPRNRWMDGFQQPLGLSAQQS